MKRNINVCFALGNLLKFKSGKITTSLNSNYICTITNQFCLTKGISYVFAFIIALDVEMTQNYSHLMTTRFLLNASDGKIPPGKSVPNNANIS